MEAYLASISPARMSSMAFWASVTGQTSLAVMLVSRPEIDMSQEEKKIILSRCQGSITTASMAEMLRAK